MEQVLLTERHGPVTVLKLNRPDKMNALSFPTLLMLREAIEALRFDPEVRVVLITGEGDKAFSAGADLKERAGMTPVQVKEFIRTIRDTFTAIEDLGKPVIAVVNGLALGGGTELALACDIRLAADSALMGLTETSLGIIPGAGGTQRLPRLVGKGKAKELIFTARRVAASEAKEIGLVEQVYPAERLMDEAMAMALKIAENGPIALEQAKYAVNAGSETDLKTGMLFESRAYDVIIPTKDRLEGLAAFREKRKPVYVGE
ncbi:enoyl-CoA hydratase [bacterium]|nr:enoyl-CoA hydratase [bacterium]